MSLVDDKYRENLLNFSVAQQELIWLQQELDSLTSEQRDRRDVIRQSMSLIRQGFNDSQIEINAKEWGQQVSVRSSENLGQVCYGEVKVGGYISFMSADEGTAGNFIHLLVTFTCHEIDGFTNIYIDGNQLTFDGSLYPNASRWSTGKYPNLIFVSCQSLGDVNQAANSHLVGQSALLFPNKWTSAHRQRGCAGVYLIMMYDAVAFPNGLPEITAKFRGKNDIYDPRSGFYGYSNNVALCAANYLTDKVRGLGYSWQEIDEESLSQAANDCDELVTLKDGSTEKRYTCNGVFAASNGNSHRTIKEQLELAMAGNIVWSGDKWYFYSGKYRPPVCTLTETHLRSDIKIQAKPSKSEVCNAVKGQYRGDLTKWEWGDFPPVANATYEAQDGERLWAEINLSFVSSASQAQRIAKILLEMSRQWIEVVATFAPYALQARAGDVVALTLDWAGWSGKTFYIRDLQEGFDGDATALSVPLQLREISAGVYEWADGEETKIDLAPNTQLPDPSLLPAPQNLSLASGTEELDIRTDGTIFARVRVSWDATTNPYVLTDGVYRIQYKKTVDSDYRDYGIIDGVLSKAWLLDVADGVSYDVRVRAETSGGKSAWATYVGYTVLGKLEPPNAPTNLVATLDRRGITLSWSGVDDLDLAGYEIRSGSEFLTASFVDITRSNSYLIPTLITGAYRYSVAAKDTSGIYSSAIAVSVEIVRPTKVQGLRALVLNNMVALAWSGPAVSSFPVREYKIKKGSDYETAELLGSISATIKTLQEFLADTYTYWVVAVDEHGNEGEETSITEYVDAPPLFELLSDRAIDFNSSITADYVVVENSDLVGPIDTTETLQEHFDNNSWATPQEQIEAGYPIYAQPIDVGPAVWEGVIDFGEVIDTVLINLSYLTYWAGGSGIVTPRLSYSLDGVTYADGTDGATQIIGTNFQFVKVKFVIDGDDDQSIARISAARVRLQIKKTSESGTTEAVSTDASGTLVNFTNTFLDIFEGSFKPAYAGSNAYFPSYTVVGNEVRVFLWDLSGARVSGDVSWSVDGIVSQA